MRPAITKKWLIPQEVDTESVYFSNPRQGRIAEEIASKMIVGLINQMKQKPPCRKAVFYHGWDVGDSGMAGFGKRDDIPDTAAQNRRELNKNDLPSSVSRCMVVEMKALDLFSGPGGLSLGMKGARIEPIACVEKSKDAIATYDAHTPTAEHFQSDIRSVSFERYRGKIDIVFGGPPCQPFSTGGLRRGTADSRNMFPEFIRTLKEVRPAAFLAENVPGLATRNRIQYLGQLLNEFEALGFNVSWNVVSAADYGVPQKRRRLIIVGLREGTFWFPKPTHGPDAHIPHVASSSVIDKSLPLGEPPDCPVIYAKYPDPRRSPYAGHVYNGGGRPIDLSVPCHTLLASAGGYKTHWVDTMDIAPDYSAHLMAGGVPREGAVPGARRMTLEESALIQTFPADMWFAGSRSSQYTQVGDAVPPMLGHALGSALRSQLEGAMISPKTHYQPEATLPLLVAA